MRLIYLAIIVLVTTSLIYYKDGLLPGFFQGWEKTSVVKKVSAVKPKSLINKAEALKPVSHKFTFFETLEDKTMTKYVGLHGEILPVSLPSSAKPSKPLLKPAVKPAKPESKVQVAKLIQEEKKPPTTTSYRFAVQVSSFRNEKMAGALKIKLQKKGFDAFLMETELPNHGGKWFRVFLGHFSDEGMAKKAADQARLEHKLNAVVVRNTLGQ